MPNVTLNDRVYRKIKDDIMYLVLEPGLAVSVQKLADTYGSSRTPVREAVVRLQQEDLVHIYPQARTAVSLISMDRIQEERFICNSLELSMVDSFIKNCSPLVVDTLENVIGIQHRAMERQKFREFFDMGNRFQRILFETAGQRLAWKIIESSNSHYSRLRYLSLRHYGFDPKVLQDDEAIMYAARQRDEDGMRKVLSKHLSKGQENIVGLPRLYPNYFTE
ncbi:GntR family transcriptional regulator [Eubacteriales bacterium mix99]|jgi:DNA-binding GntR family transcriptional regulator